MRQSTDVSFLACVWRNDAVNSKTNSKTPYLERRRRRSLFARGLTEDRFYACMPPFAKRRREKLPSQSDEKRFARLTLSSRVRQFGTINKGREGAERSAFRIRNPVVLQSKSANKPPSAQKDVCQGVLAPQNTAFFSFLCEIAPFRGGCPHSVRRKVLCAVRNLSTTSSRLNDATSKKDVHAESSRFLLPLFTKILLRGQTTVRRSFEKRVFIFDYIRFSAVLMPLCSSANQ